MLYLNNMTYFQSTEAGEIGEAIVHALRHADQEVSPEPANVTIRLLLMEVQHAQDQARAPQPAILLHVLATVLGAL